jgi:hypothetical protein
MRRRACPAIPFVRQPDSRGEDRRPHPARRASAGDSTREDLAIAHHSQLPSSLLVTRHSSLKS